MQDRQLGLFYFENGRRLCELDGCDRFSLPNRSKGQWLCAGHSKRLRRWGTTMIEMPLDKVVKTGCDFPKCDGEHHARGFCRSHSDVLRKYGFAGITLLIQHDGRCAACRSSDPGHRNGWFIDHDHITGEVRSVICHKCNSAVGLLGEDPRRARGLMDYIRQIHIQKLQEESE